jgi:alpha-L-arabinofuranosidase
VLLALAVFAACDSLNKPEASEPNSEAPAANSEAKGEMSTMPAQEPLQTTRTVTIEIDAGKLLQSKPISRYMTGMNTFFSYWTDDVRPKLIPYLQQLRVGMLRYPGGEINSYFHWDYPAIPAKTPWIDAWDPAVKAEPYKNKQTPNMDIDEYMQVIKLTGAEPMVGVNIESGVKYNRVQDSVDEAVRNLKYTLDRGYNIKYWFLDNESYHEQSHVQMKVEEYAQYVNMFSAALKKADPSIQTVVNWNTRLNGEWKKLIELAGDSFDVGDKHYYWSHGTASYEKWLKQNPLTMFVESGKQGPVLKEFTDFRKVIAEATSRPIKIGVMEWNLGGKPTAPVSPYQYALVQSELMGEMLKGGVDMATFWPLIWQGQDEKTLLNSKTLKPNPNLHVFAQYSNVIGHTVIESTSSLPNVYTVATVDPERRSAVLFLINKSEAGQATKANVKLSKLEPSAVQAVSLTTDNLSGAEGTMKKLNVVKAADGSGWSVDLPPHSFTAVTFGINKSGLKQDIENASRIAAASSDPAVKEPLFKAANTAEQVWSSSSASQAEVDHGSAALHKAMAEFAAKAIQPPSR